MFWQLYEESFRLEAAEELRLLRAIAVGMNPGEKGRGLRKLVNDLSARAFPEGSAEEKPPSRVIPGVTPGTSVTKTPGEISKLRERQKAAEERLQREHAERQGSGT